MASREFLQLAHTYDQVKHSPAGWYASEKLDGCRALWDGNITRGMLASQVPFANTAKKSHLIEEPVSTGLWSRYGNVIHAPDWFLDQLPVDICLDGELYLGPGQFQETMSIIKQHNPDQRWDRVKYAVFDSPSLIQLFSEGKINNPQFKKIIGPDTLDWALAKCQVPNAQHRFYEVLDWLTKYLPSGPATLHWQEKLPSTTNAAVDRMNELMDIVLSHNGEGLILRKPESFWTPKRTWNLLKYKPLNDDEGICAGYTWGRGRYENLMGAMVVDWCNRRFEISGFTDAERELVCIDSGKKASGVPGSVVDNSKVTSKHFPVGCKVTFMYRELTVSGIPKECRYFRKG